MLSEMNYKTIKPISFLFFFLLNEMRHFAPPPSPLHFATPSDASEPSTSSFRAQGGLPRVNASSVTSAKGTRASRRVLRAWAPSSSGGQWVEKAGNAIQDQLKKRKEVSFPTSVIPRSHPQQVTTPTNSKVETLLKLACKGNTNKLSVQGALFWS